VIPPGASTRIALYTPAPKARAKKEEGVTKQQRSFGALVRDMFTRIGRPRTHELGTDTSVADRTMAIEGLLEAMWPGAWVYVCEMFDDYVIAERDSAYFQIPYAVADDGTVTLGEPITEVERTWREKSAPSMNTPHANKNAGTPGKEDDMAITKALATALGLPETADEPAVLKAIGDLKGASEKFSAQSGELAALREEVKTLKADGVTAKATAAVDEAVRAKKILPAQREWALGYAASDPKGFATFVEKAQEQLDTTERGSGKDAPEPQSEVVTFRAKVAEKVKAGMAIDAAQRAVATEEPELFAAVYGRR
jgi:hypothetical protein